MIRLNELPMDTPATIHSLECTGSIRRRLLDLGIVDGTTILPILISPSGDPVAYEIRGSIIALRKEDSQLIKVNSSF